MQIGESENSLVSTKKIRFAEREDLSKILRVVMFKLGFKANNLPDKVATELLHAHIRKWYSHISCVDISLAFDLAIAGKLDLPLSEVKAYQDFSCFYFSTIVNSYISYSSKLLKEVKEKIEQPAVFTDEQYWNEQRHNVEYFFQRARHGFVFHQPEQFADVLLKDNLLGLVEVPEHFEGALTVPCHTRDETAAEFFVRKLADPDCLTIYQKID